MNNKCKYCKEPTLHDEYCSSFCQFKGNDCVHKECDYEVISIVEHELRLPIDKKCLQCNKQLYHRKNTYCSQSCVQKHMWNNRRFVSETV